MMKRDHYAVLGVVPEASTEEIKRAYHRLLRLWHPDRNRNAVATAKCQAINAAYECLGDPSHRAAYDLARTPVRILPPPPAREEPEYDPWTAELHPQEDDNWTLWFIICSVVGMSLFSWIISILKSAV